MKEAIIPCTVCSIACLILVWGIPRMIRDRPKMYYKVEIYKTSTEYPDYIIQGEILKDKDITTTQGRIVVEFK